MALAGTLVSLVYAVGMLTANVADSVAFDRTPSAFVPPLYTLTQPGLSFGVSSNYSWLQLLAPTLYLLVALSWPLSRGAWQVHVHLAALVASGVVIGIWQVRQQEQVGLRHVHTLRTLEVEEEQAREALGRLVPDPVVHAIGREAEYRDSRRAEAFPEAAVLVVELLGVNAMADEAAASHPARMVAEMINTVQARSAFVARARPFPVGSLPAR